MAGHRIRANKALHRAATSRQRRWETYRAELDAAEGELQRLDADTHFIKSLLRMDVHKEMADQFAADIRYSLSPWIVRLQEDNKPAAC